MATEAEPDLSEYNGWQLVVTASVLLGLTWIAVGLRVYARVYLTHGFLVDDWFMVTGLATFTISCTFILLGCAAGLGYHNRALPDDNVVEALKWQILATGTYVLDTMVIKISIGMFLLRLSVKRRYRYIIWATIFIVVIWSIVLFFWHIFQCNPVKRQWDNRIPGSCTASEQFVSAAYSFSVMTVLSDWLFALLPIPMIWAVNMTVQAKLTVILVLGMGVFASVATLIRIAFLADLNNNTDTVYYGTESMVWTLVEPGMAIIAGSVATIRPILIRLGLPGFDSSNQSGRGASSSGRNGDSGKNPHLRTFGTVSFSSRRNRKPGDLTLIDLECGDDGKGEYAKKARSGRRVEGSPEAVLTIPDSTASRTALATDQQNVGMAVSCDGDYDDDGNAGGSGGRGWTAAVHDNRGAGLS